jgi:hypothetical protein
MPSVIAPPARDAKIRVFMPRATTKLIPPRGGATVFFGPTSDDANDMLLTSDDGTVLLYMTYMLSVS